MESSARDPGDDILASDFLRSFEYNYGSRHPQFVELGWKEAARVAEQQSKLLFAYVHAPEHEALFRVSAIAETVCLGHRRVLSSGAVFKRSCFFPQSEFHLLGRKRSSLSGLLSSICNSCHMLLMFVRLVGGKYRSNDVSIYVSSRTHWWPIDSDCFHTGQHCRNAVSSCASASSGRTRLCLSCPTC